MTWFDKIIPYASSNSKKFKNVDHVETDRHRKKTGRKRRNREGGVYFFSVLRFWYLFASGFSVFDQFLCGFSVLKVACGSRYRRKNLHGFSVRSPFFHRFFGFFAAICLISFYIIREFKNHSQQP